MTCDEFMRLVKTVPIHLASRAERVTSWQHQRDCPTCRAFMESLEPMPDEHPNAASLDALADADIEANDPELQ